jgi:phosphotransferase system  glucose/maltose/N-acetylglucosamine-specific IIC component
MEIFIIWLGLAIVVGVAASNRGRAGFGWFILAILVSPLIAGLLVLVLPNQKLEVQRATEVANSRKCPMCAELVKRDALVCKHCGRDLPPIEYKTIRQHPEAGKGDPGRGALIFAGIMAVGAVIIAVILIYREPDRPAPSFQPTDKTMLAPSLATNPAVEVVSTPVPLPRPAPKQRGQNPSAPMQLTPER